MERVLFLTYAIVPGAVVADLFAALLLAPAWGLSYLESLRGLLFFTGLGLVFLGGAVGGSGRVAFDWRTQYISSRGAQALAEHNVKRLDTHGTFLIVTILAGIALLAASFLLPG